MRRLFWRRSSSSPSSEPSIGTVTFVPDFGSGLPRVRHALREDTTTATSFTPSRTRTSRRASADPAGTSHTSRTARPEAAATSSIETPAKSSSLALDWTLRQPKDAPWCWPAREFYPCGCDQDDWSFDDSDDPERYQCEQCAPLATYYAERDRIAARFRGQESQLNRFYTDWLTNNGWIGSPMDRLGNLLKEFYLPAVIDQLNSPILLMGGLLEPADDPA